MTIKETRDKLAAQLETAASDSISLRTSLMKAGGAAKLRAMDKKSAANAMREAATKLQAERKKSGGSTKFAVKDIVDWATKNASGSGSAKKAEPKTEKPEAKKIDKPAKKESKTKDEPADPVHTDAEEKQWYDDMVEAQKSKYPKKRLDSAIFYLGIDVDKQSPNGNAEGTIDASLLKKWLPKAMKNMGMKDVGGGEYELPSGDRFFVGKDKGGNARFSVKSGGYGTPADKHRDSPVFKTPEEARKASGKAVSLIIDLEKDPDVKKYKKLSDMYDMMSETQRNSNATKTGIGQEVKDLMANPKVSQYSQAVKDYRMADAQYLAMTRAAEMKSEKGDSKKPDNTAKDGMSKLSQLEAKKDDLVDKITNAKDASATAKLEKELDKVKAEIDRLTEERYSKK